MRKASVTTDENGRFWFRVKASANRQVPRTEVEASRWAKSRSEAHPSGSDDMAVERLRPDYQDDLPAGVPRLAELVCPLDFC